MVNGSADIGFADSGYVENQVAAGKLPSGVIKFVNELRSPQPLPGYYPHATSVSVGTPGYTLVAMPTAQAASVSARVVQALLTVQRTNPLAIAADYGGWVRRYGIGNREPQLSLLTARHLLWIFLSLAYSALCPYVSVCPPIPVYAWCRRLSCVTRT